MTRSDRIEHTSFSIEREFSASPKHVFRFWSEAALKARWNDCHLDWRVLEHTFDFREGGAEVKRWLMPNGEELTFHAHYLDIVPAGRIIYAYEMSCAGKRLSASLVTIIFETIGHKTKMAFTEQVAILAGGKAAGEQRLVGTEEGLDRLVKLVETASDAAV